MERLKSCAEAELRRRMQSRFEQLIKEVAAAVNQAPDGRLIDASEERCRELLDEFRRQTYQEALQARIEATESDPAFSPEGQPAPRPLQPPSAHRVRTREPDPATLPACRRPEPHAD